VVAVAEAAAVVRRTGGAQDRTYLAWTTARILSDRDGNDRGNRFL